MSQRGGLRSVKSSRPSGSAPRSCSALPRCWRSRPSAWRSPISASSTSRRASPPTARASRGRPGPQYRPRAGLLPRARPLLRRRPARKRTPRRRSAAEASLKDAIDQAMQEHQDPARPEQIDKLAREFANFTKIFAEILKAKRRERADRAEPADPQRDVAEYKLDDLANTATDADLQAVEFGAKQVAAQFQAARRCVNTFRRQRRSDGRRPARWRG